MIAIAIDGPAGAGKSTIARRAAAELGYIYVDTGALYRSIAWYMTAKKIEPKETEALFDALKQLEVRLDFVNGEQHVFVLEQDVTGLIRTPEISMAASAFSALPAVRAFLLELQRDISRKNNVIMDGRDIGTVVLPNAKIKIFLTASAEVRAKRRYKELLEKNHPAVYEEVLAEINERDYNDAHRPIAPLKPSEDSVLVDTSELSLAESIEALLRVIRERL